MTDHPAAHFGKTGIRVFEMIALEKAGNHGAPKMIEKLMARGLIEQIESIVKHDRFGTFTIPQYRVKPKPMAQWVDWSCEQEGVK